MTTKTRNIVSIVLGIIPCAMLVMSGVMKLSANPDMVKHLTAGGFGKYITLFGALELIFVILFFIPKTKKIGFLFSICYLGGAMSVEIGSGGMVITPILIALLWISMYIKDKNVFLTQNNEAKN